MGYTYGLDTVPWSIFCFFGVEKVPKVQHESVLPSQNSCQKIKNGEICKLIPLAGRFDTYGKAWGWWMGFKYPGTCNNQHFSANFRRFAHLSRGTAGAISRPIHLPTVQKHRLCLLNTPTFLSRLCCIFG